jgi:DNA-binding winged helix-turn-helix (wHTH) protein
MKRSRRAFGDVVVDLETGAVTVAGRPVALSPRLSATLRVLVEHANRPVHHATILRTVWPATHVVSNSVAQAVAALRRALASSAGGWRIEALPGVGYTLIADVDAAGSRRWVRGLIVSGAAAAGALAAFAGGLWAGRARREPGPSPAVARLVVVATGLPAAALIVLLLGAWAWLIRRLEHQSLARCRTALFVGCAVLLGISFAPVYGAVGEHTRFGNLAELLFDDELYRATFTRAQIAVLGSPD